MGYNPAMVADAQQFVSRGGEKLAAALDAFGIDPTGMTCADFGANVGGFTDCLLRRGAAKVYAIDTGYGELAWTLRKDSRVVVMERTNALHCDVLEPVDLVTIDMAWTPQGRSVPAAAGWLTADGRIISLLKCHYEHAKLDPPKGGPRGKGGSRARPAKLSADQAEQVRQSVCQQLSQQGYVVEDTIPSPILGKGGGQEYLLLISPQR